MDEVDVDDAPLQTCQAWGHVMEEGTHRCWQHRACIDRDLHELYAMSEESEGPAEEDSTTVAAPVDVG